ncbi:MAG: pyrroline-5-carboxylate reductase [Halieaceae bacterium]|jgi:pyrroline-5-carboxylate reductase
MTQLKNDRSPENTGTANTAREDKPLSTVLMIGCGQMGGALLSQWQLSEEFAFTIVSPSGKRALPKQAVQVRSASELGKQRFSMLVIAVKPQMIESVVPDYLAYLAPNGIIVSIAAGFSCTSLRSVAPRNAAVRIMPNLPVAMGKGVSGLYADERVSPQSRSQVERLMQSTGHLIWVSCEDELDRVTAIAGSGPGYAFEIARCWAQAGQALGFSREQSREIVLKTMKGAIDLALASDASLDELRERVTSKNGTTQAGLRALNGDAQLGALLDDTLRAAYARAVELR